VSLHQLLEIQVTHPGWRAWQTVEGEFAARKGGSTPIGVQARGRTVAELKLAISVAILAAANREPTSEQVLPVLRPHEQAVLNALEAATEPLTARAVADLSGVPTSTTANALATLFAKDLVTRRRVGRAWLYACV
jgi:IclR helix-turn-helix domain